MTGYENSLADICRQFTDEPVTETRAFSEGHINDTYFVRTTGGRFVLQRMQPKMDPEKLQTNYELYSSVCESVGWAYPKWMHCNGGTYFFTEAAGNRWRMYPYIEAETLQTPLTKEQLYACGKGLFKLHGILQKLPAKPEPVYSMLHDLGVYYEKYLATLKGSNLCEERRVFEIEERIQKEIERFLPAKTLDTRIIHGDAKLSNILFRDGEVFGMIDWDTVMVGSASEEIADCIRSCCVDRGDFDREAADILLKGYQSGAEESAEAGRTEKGKADAFSPDEIVTHVPQAFDKINFELALRYYTDVISKEKAFKERYPGYRLTRVRELLGVTWR